MPLTRTQTIIIGIAVIVVLFFVLLLLGFIPGLKPSGGNGASTARVNLSFWGVSEAGNQDSIASLINEYKKTNSNVSLTYRQFDSVHAYEKNLINALATSQGPDIFMFKSGWLVKNYAKASPLSGTSFSLAQLRQLFPQVVEKDFVLSSQIYALPLYIDTLAMIYNKDIFDSSSVALMPKTWSDFQSMVPQLRKVNILNQITRPAAAIGGSNKSIDTASDLLNLFMIQSGSQFINSMNQVDFGSQGLSGFNSYLGFSNPNSPYYTWNDNLTYSLDSFSQNQTAAIFDYYSSVPLIKEKNPYLNIGIALMPQLNPDQPVNWANYWGLSVSNQSGQKDWAWHFIISVTTDSQISETYLQTAKKPPALRSLIAKYKNDPDLGIFANQALTARSWQQPDSDLVKQYFSSAIQSVLSGQLNSEQALRQAQTQINELK